MPSAAKVKVKNQRKRKNKINFLKISDYHRKANIKKNKKKEMMTKINHSLPVEPTILQKEM